jgi:protein-S-isoprenylcysteine O-methyltransferase Ste14
MQKIIFTAALIAFIGIRAKFHNPNQSEKEVKPKREIILASQFSLSMMICHFLWLFNTDWFPEQMNLIANFIGGSLMLGSLPFLYWVHHSLGTFFSARLELQENHQIIQTGPYQWIRHPMYTAGFMYLLGAGLLSGSWLILILPTLSFTLLVFSRVSDEEQMLLEHFGDDYQNYMQQTGRFLPFI